MAEWLRRCTRNAFSSEASVQIRLVSILFCWYEIITNFFAPFFLIEADDYDWQEVSGDYYLLLWSINSVWEVIGNEFGELAGHLRSTIAWYREAEKDAFRVICGQCHVARPWQLEEEIRAFDITDLPAIRASSGVAKRGLLVLTWSSIVAMYILDRLPWRRT